MIVASEGTRILLRTTSRAGALVLSSLLLLCLWLPAQTDKPEEKTAAADSAIPVIHVLGMEGVKRQGKGTLKVEADGLHFAGGGYRGDIPFASIQDVFTGQDSHQVGGKVLTLTKMGIPYS